MTEQVVRNCYLWSLKNQNPMFRLRKTFKLDAVIKVQTKKSYQTLCLKPSSVLDEQQISQSRKLLGRGPPNQHNARNLRNALHWSKRTPLACLVLEFCITFCPLSAACGMFAKTDHCLSVLQRRWERVGSGSWPSRPLPKSITVAQFIGLVVSRVLGIPEAMTLTAATMQILNPPKNDHSVKNKKVKSATDD